MELDVWLYMRFLQMKVFSYDGAVCVCIESSNVHWVTGTFNTKHRYPETFQVAVTESETAMKKFPESGYQNAAVCHQAQ
jgi:hypothetical protein